jgi:hypothetical protein
MRFEKVKFFYSTQHEVGDLYPCENDKALEQLKELEGKGVEVESVDLASGVDTFRDYHAACNAPPMPKRSVFGAKGATEEDFGMAVPCLSGFYKADDKKPSEVFPRNDKDLGKMLLINEAIDLIISDGLPE